MNRRKTYLPIITISCWLLAVGCTDELEDNSQQTSKLVQFDVDMSNDWQRETGNSRGDKAQTVIPMTANDANTGLTLTATAVPTLSPATRGIANNRVEDAFAVLAYDYENVNTWGSDAVAITYTDIASPNVTSTTWTMATARTWPADGHSLRYVGYLPATSTNIIDVSATGDTGVPYIKWSANTTVGNQEDLMTAVSPVSNYGTNNGHIKMPFRHALTCVRFAIGEGFPTGAVIDRIEVMGAAREGTLWIEENALHWDVDATTRSTFTMEDIDFATSTANAIIAPAMANGEQQTTLLMVPQTFDDTINQKIRLTYHVGSGAPVTLTATLDGQTWEPGTTITYIVSNSTAPQTAVLTVSAGAVSWLGGQLVFNVTSYAANVSDGSYNHDLAWRIVGYSEDDGTTFHTEKPASCNWTSIVTTNGTGGIAEQQGYATVARQTEKTTLELSRTSTDDNYADKVLREQLKANSTFGADANYHDLSIHDLTGNRTKRNTANCYVINRPGWYKLPLIYGNAIKDGEPNTIAWTATPKIAYSGSVGSPYIQENGTPNDAILCWQDADGLVAVESALEYNSTEGIYYMKFKVDESTIRPGNAVIAVRNSSNVIMWSWHIWVTPAEIRATKECYAQRHGVRFNFMSIPLGWIPMNGTLQKYKSRSMLVKIAQEGGKTAVFRITQLPGADTEDATYGYAPYYQFGRKDPMLPSDGNTSTDHAQYPTGGSYLWKKVVTTNATYTYAQGIQNPHTFYATTTGTADWCKTTYYNLWNTGSVTGYTNFKVIKTIYDPCPVGFKMPSSGAMAFFTTEDNTVNETLAAAKLNKATNFDRGWRYYTTPAKTETIYIPSLTCRERNTGILRSYSGGYVGEQGWYWSAMGGSPSITIGKTAYNYADRGACTGTHSSGASPHCQWNRAWGFTIQPIEE